MGWSGEHVTRGGPFGCVDPSTPEAMKERYKKKERIENTLRWQQAIGLMIVLCTPGYRLWTIFIRSQTPAPLPYPYPAPMQCADDAEYKERFTPRRGITRHVILSAVDLDDGQINGLVKWACGRMTHCPDPDSLPRSAPPDTCRRGCPDQARRLCPGTGASRPDTRRLSRGRQSCR